MEYVFFLIVSLHLCYLGYNIFFDTMKFTSNYARLSCLSPKIYRKQLRSGFYIGEYKITSVLLMIMGFFLFVVSILKMLGFNLQNINFHQSQPTVFMLFILNMIVFTPILMCRIQLIRKLNKGKLISYRIKNHSLKFINRRKEANQKAQVLYIKYNILTILYWLYWFFCFLLLIILIWQCVGVLPSSLFR